KCVEDVEQSGVATFVLVLRAAPEGAPGPFRFLQVLRRFLFWLYKNVDRRLFRSSPDAHAPIDLRSALPNCRVLDGADLLQDEQLDVVLDPRSEERRVGKDMMIRVLALTTHAW